MINALLAAALAATLAGAPTGATAPVATPTPMAVPGPKAAPEAGAKPTAKKPGRQRAATRSKRGAHPVARRARKPGDQAGTGPKVPAGELALPQAAPFYDKKGRYMPTVYIYQETNGEFRILSPGGEARPAGPAAAAPPAAAPPAAAPPPGALPAEPGPAAGGGETAPAGEPPRP